MSWPQGSTTKLVRDVRPGDEVLVALMFRVVDRGEVTDAGYILHFRDRGVPPRLYSGPDAVVVVWDTATFGPGVPEQMSIY